VDLETGEIVEGNVGVSVYEYPDGVELTAVPRTPSRPKKDVAEREWLQYEQDVRAVGPEEAKRRADERQAARAERTSDESVRRAKTRVRRVVRYFGLRYMVTLTFPGEGVHDYNQGLRVLQDFIHDHGARLHLGGQYVAVPELHPRGHGWHWHVLVGRRFSRAELRALRVGWTAFLGRKGMHPSGGATWVRIDVKDWGTSANAGGYASKYVGKSFEAAELGKNRRRFLASHGAVVQSEKAWAESLSEVEAVCESVPGGQVVLTEREDGRPAIVWAVWES
jgi:hypothetical protein